MSTTTFPDVPLPAGGAVAWDRRRQAALERIERGTFGLCMTCKRPIERRRINADPLAERCIACARSLSRHGCPTRRGRRSS